LNRLLGSWLDNRGQRAVEHSDGISMESDFSDIAE
jgi:hypothetical protein